MAAIAAMAAMAAEMDQWMLAAQLLKDRLYIGQEVAGSGPVILVAIFSFDPFSFLPCVVL